jgi:hypothetical protein
MLFGSPLDITTICILTSQLIICKASMPQFLCVQNFTKMRKVKLKREYSVTIFPYFREKRSLKFEGKENLKRFHHIWTLPFVW